MKIKTGLASVYTLVILLLASEPCKSQTSGKDTTFLIGHTAIDIQYPLIKPKGTILLLPGWNFSRKKTCEQSTFCQKAKEAGFILVEPEMEKSIYASAVYPESRKDWIVFPQLHFITDTLIRVLQQQFNLLKPGQNNFVFGISTGARGGALLLEHTNNLFLAGALLSGDYDQLLDINDNLMKGYYGPAEQFKQRWEGEDNPSRNVEKIKAAVYLGHGKKDAVVPFFQSQNFYQLLVKQKIKVQFAQPEGEGHNYAFWGSQTEAVLAFFKDRL